MDTYVGFDSAWTDNPKAPGAICALQVEGDGEVRFHQPRLARFCEALEFIRSVQSPSGCTLVALDQPTIVPNLTGMRPVEKTAASLVSWLGGGVQPSKRGKTGMFCEASPIWDFLRRVDAIQHPERARTDETGLHLIEVFPAIALPSLDARFFGQQAAPKYNPANRKKYRHAAWIAVAEATAEAFRQMAMDAPEAWCREVGARDNPRKEHQDCLDAMLCLIVALRWRLAPRDQSIVLGCLENGYMVLPANPDVRERLETAAHKRGVPIDGVIATKNAAAPR